MAIYTPPTQNALTKTLSAQLNAGATTMSLSDVVGISNAAGVCVIDRVDANNNPTASKREYISFTGVSGSTLTGLSRGLAGSTDQIHAVGAIVEFVFDVVQAQAIKDTFETEHNENGTHSDVTLDSLTVNSGGMVKGWDGWIADTDTWVYVSASSFKVEGKDVTAKFPKGTKIKLTQTSAKYFYVTAASFSTDTTVTVTAGSEYTLANAAITSPYYSYMATPQGFPEEGFEYTPTISTTANAGTFTGVKFQINGNMVMYKGRITYAKALASGNLTLSLPVNHIFSLAPSGGAHFFDSGVSDKRCFVHFQSTSTINFYLTDGNSDFTGTFVNSSNWSSGDWIDWACSYPWIA